MSSDRKRLSLTKLIVGGLTVWAVVCYFIHGPAIAAYLAIQAITSGIFAWEMRRIERRAEEQKLARLQQASSGESVTETRAA
jgi:hypothetical protein